MDTKDKATEKAKEVLHDLIQINNDRIQGYEKAAGEIKDPADAEIKSIFYQMAEESRHYKDNLNESLVRLGGKREENSTASGKIYRAWMDVKATFSGDNTFAALQSCEFGEDAALKAYREALVKKSELPGGVRSVIETQYELLKVSHNRIRRYRDEFAAAKTH